MKRASVAALAFVAAACSASPSSTPPPASPPPFSSPPATAQPAFGGSVGGRAFVARSALMIHVNRRARECSSAATGTGGCSTDKDGWDVLTSSIRIYERPVRCEDLGDASARRELALRSGERQIEIDLVARWPVFPGSVWKVDAHGPANPHDDQIRSVTFRAGGSSLGSLAYGEVRVLSATPRDGAIAMNVTSGNPGLALSGSISGAIPFAVCPER